jgi:hypothetical protein
MQLNDGSKLILYADDMALVHPLDSENSTDRIQEDVTAIKKSICELQLGLNAKNVKSR